MCEDHELGLIPESWYNAQEVSDINQRIIQVFGSVKIQKMFPLCIAQFWQY